MADKVNSKILEVKKINSAVKLFYLKVPKKFNFVPGQHVFLELNIDEKIHRRAYSIVDYDKKKSLIELCVKKSSKGYFAKELFKLKKEDKINFLGPIGHFKLQNLDKKNNIVFLSAGTGIAPIKSMIEFLISKKHKGKIILFSGSKTSKDSFYSKRFEKLEKENKNFEFHKILSQNPDKGYGKSGRVQDFLEKYVSDLNDFDYYICGLKEMVNDVKKKLLDLGVERTRIFFEKY